MRDVQPEESVEPVLCITSQLFIRMSDSEGFAKVEET